MGKTGHHLITAVDPCKVHICWIAAQCKGFFNNRSEILIFPDMDKSGIRNNFRGENPVCVTGFGRHQAIGGKENGCRKFGKLFLLILPGCAEIAFKVCIFFQFRVCVGRQHFPVGVDVDTFTLRLFKEKFEVTKIVARNNDEGPFFYCQINLCGSGISVGFSVGFIQESHTLEVDRAHFHDDGKQFIHPPLFRADGRECFVEKLIHISISVAKYISMVSVCGNAADTEQNK